MTDRELDAVIRRALEANLRAEFPGVFDFSQDVPWPQTSPAHRRWERGLLADPAGFARRRRRPVWQKALRTAACLVLCTALALGAVMAASPSARAWVVDRVVTWMQTYAEFQFLSSDPHGVTADWRPAYIPEGFEETEADWDEAVNELSVVYENHDGLRITIIALPAEQGGSFLVDNEHADYQEIEVNGQPASLFISNTDGYPNYLLWTSADKGTMFVLMSRISTDEIIAIAGSCA